MLRNKSMVINIDQYIKRNVLVMICVIRTQAHEKFSIKILIKLFRTLLTKPQLLVQFLCPFLA